VEDEWLVSASCEDLSDHMRTLVFEQRNNNKMAATDRGHDDDVDHDGKELNNVTLTS
jgi:hypothetical protein